MIYAIGEKRNLIMYIGLGISLFGVVVYDPLGLVYKGAGLIVLGIGLICMFVGYKYPTEVETVNKTVLEVSKHLDDPSKLEDLLSIFDERKKEPIDYRRGGVITIFVGIGICLLGYAAMGSFFVGIGYLVGAIGIGTMVAGYLYPNTSEELTNAVEDYEKK